MADSVNLGSVFASLELRTDKWNTSINQVKSGMSGVASDMNKKLDTIGEGFLKAGAVLTAGLSVPLMLFGKSSMNTAVDIEVAWKEVEKVYGSTADAFARDSKAIEKAVDELANKFGKSKIEVLDITSALAAMGYEGTKLIDMMTQSMEFATTGQMSLNEAMNGAVAISKIYGVEGDDLRKVLATLNVVENSTAASMSDLAEATQIAGSVGKSAGIDINELSSFMAVLRERAIPAGEAADGLKTIFTRLRAPTADAQKILDKYNITVSDSNGNLLEADKILKLYSEKWGQLTDIEREELSASSAGLYQKNKFLAIMEDLSSANSTYNKTLAETANTTGAVARYEEEMNKFLDTNKTKIAQANIAWTDFKIAIGGIIADMLVPLLKSFSGLAKVLSEQSEPIKKIIVAFGLFAAAIGPVLIVVGSLMKALTGIQAFFAAGGIGEALIAVATGPVGWIIGAIVALAVAFGLLWSKSEAFRNQIYALRDSLLVVWTFMSENIIPIFTQLWTYIKDNIVPVFLEMWNVIAKLLAPIFNKIKEQLVELWNKFTELWEVISPYILPILKALAILVGGILLLAFAALAVGVGIILGVIYGIIWVVTKVIEAIIWFVEEWKREWNNAKEKVKEQIDAIIAVINWIGDLPGKALQWGKDFIDNFKTGLLNGLESLKKAVNGAVSWIKDKLGFSTNPYLPTEIWGKHMVENFAGGIAKAMPEIENAMRMFEPQLATQFDTIGSSSLPSVDLSSGSKLSNSSNQTININVGTLIGDESSLRDLEKRVARATKQNALSRGQDVLSYLENANE